MENKKNWIIIVVAILALGGGGYGACVAMTDGAQENLIDDTVADPGVDPPPMAETDAGALAVEIDTPEANPVDIPTEPIEGVIAQPEMEEMPENVVQQALPPQVVLEGVPQRREEPCNGDPTCESEQENPRDDRMTSNEPGPVH
jgi:hypothetical protein